jgi:transposase InsO family protein
MSKIMPKHTKEEKLRWIRPILEKRMSIRKMSLVCPFSERSLKNWLKAFKECGEAGLENKSTRPKTCPNETPIRLKERVIELRKETRLCAVKLKWRLAKEGISLSPRVIGKILKKEGLLRKYRTRKQKSPFLKKGFAPGELVEVDIKWVPETIRGFRYFQYTAIDSSSRWRHLKIYDNPGSNSSLDFVRELIRVAPFRIRAIKTDNGSCFTNRYVGYMKSKDPLNPRIHPFDELCDKLGIVHYLIDPGKPAQNGKVERSHRTDQERFYSLQTFKNVVELKKKLLAWNEEYNNTEHISLNGLTPNEALGKKVQNVCA